MGVRKFPPTEAQQLQEHIEGCGKKKGGYNLWIRTES